MSLQESLFWPVAATFVAATGQNWGSRGPNGRRTPTFQTASERSDRAMRKLATEGRAIDAGSRHAGIAVALLPSAERDAFPARLSPAGVRRASENEAAGNDDGDDHARELGFHDLPPWPYGRHLSLEEG